MVAHVVWAMLLRVVEVARDVQRGGVVRGLSQVVMVVLVVVSRVSQVFRQ